MVDLDSGSNLPILHYLNILRKRWLLAVIAFLSVLVTTALYESRRAPSYSCSVEFLIKPEPLAEQVRNLQPAARKRFTDMNFQFYVDYARSDACAAAVVATGALGEPPPEKSPAWLNLIEKVLGSISAEQVGERRLVRVTATGSDPDFVYRLANAYGTSYPKSLNEDLLSSTRRMIEYVDREISRTELEIAHYRSLIGLSDEHAQKSSPPLELDLGVIRETRRVLRSRMQMVEEIGRALDEGQTPTIETVEIAITSLLDGVPPALASTLGGTAREQMETARGVFLEKAAIYRRLGRSLTDLHPDRAVARAALYDAASELIAQLELWYRVADAQLAERQASAATAPRTASATAAEHDTLVADPQSRDRYRTELSLRENLLQELIRKKSNLQVDLSGRENMAEWVRPAVRPTTIDLPSFQDIFPLSAGLGILVAIAAVILVESLDASIKTPFRAESTLGKRVLGIVPRFHPETGLDPADHLVITGRPTSTEAEAYRSLAHKLDVLPQRWIVLTSTGPQEGKSTTSANLSLALAEMGRRVLLVSANLRRPTIHTFFGLPEAPGLREVVLEGLPLGNAIKPSGHPRLDVLPSGDRTVGTIASAITSPRLTEILRAACADYDFVITDVPPCAPVSDALNFARVADGVLLVYMIGKASEASVTGVIRSIEDVGGTILGVVMNDVRGVGSAYGYSYGYGYGYASAEDDRK